MVTIKEWEAYSHFLDYFRDNKDYANQLSEKFPDLKGNLAKELYVQARTYAKEKCNVDLKNLWDYFDLNPTGAFQEFYKPKEGESSDLDCLYLSSILEKVHN